MCIDIRIPRNLHLLWFFVSNFMIMLLCKNFINYHKSGFEAATYLTELLNNSNSSNVKNIYLQFPLILCFPNVRQSAQIVALWGHEIQSTYGISRHHVQNRRSCLWRMRHRTWLLIGAGIKANSTIPLSSLFFLYMKVHTCAPTLIFLLREEWFYLFLALSYLSCL